MLDIDVGCENQGIEEMEMLDKEYLCYADWPH